MTGGLLIHPRVKIVNQARNDISLAFLDVSERFELTPAEQSSILYELMGTCLKYVLRFERHGNYEKRGSEA